MDEEVRAALHRFGQMADDAVPLAEAALNLSAARSPGLNLAPHRRHLDRLTQEVDDFAASAAKAGDLQARRDALVQIVIRRYGYGGNEAVFRDLDAANLAKVIDARRGLPVSLGIIYLEICARLGWSLVGIDFPGRFVMRLQSGAERMIVDPFDDLRALDAPDLRRILKAVSGGEIEMQPRFLSEMSPRRVLLRLEDNIRIRQMQKGDLASAAETLDLMVSIAPGAAGLWREAGVVNAQLDRVNHAVQALETYLRLEPGGKNSYQASLLLQELRTRLN